MGKIADPNMPYCDGLQQASLSVAGQTFSTKNPPISYVVENSQATIYDANGVVGIVDLTGDQLKEISRSPASPNVTYCGGVRAKLTWNSGEIETSNPPISYQLLPSNVVTWGAGGTTQGSYSAPSDVSSVTISNSNKLIVNGETQTFPKPITSWQNIPQPQIRIDWGNGDIQLIDGATSSTTKPVETRIAYLYDCQWEWNQTDGGIGGFRSNVPSWDTPAPYIFGCNGFAYVMAAVTSSQISFPSTETSCGLNFERSYNVFCPPREVAVRQVLISLSRNNNFLSPRFARVNGIVGTAVSCQQTRTTITSDLGQVAQRWGDLNPTITPVVTSCTLRATFDDGTTQDLSYPSCPTVSSVSGCSIKIVYADSSTELIAVDSCPEWVGVSQNKLEVYDETGLILEQSYQSPPSNFQAICYGYDLKEVSYSCEGECPSGTEFQCKCGNTLMCYGFDPNNPNLFSPLFTTEITT